MSNADQAAWMRPETVEPTARWVRVRLGDELVADTKRALLLVRYGRDGLPTYFAPIDDVATDALVDRRDDPDGIVRWTVRVGDRDAVDAAWAYAAPAGALAALADHVSFDWDGLDWFEEEQQVWVHAKDPRHRVDVLASSRHVVVEVDGQVLADSDRPSLLFETSLPVRYYLPAEDVRLDLLEASDARSVCPFKGTASYYSARIDDRLVVDIAWTYPDPIPENPKIKDLVCFFNERVDLTVDGEHLERPWTPWSPSFA